MHELIPFLQEVGGYFNETDEYWAPADNENELYYQFSQKKYCEIFRDYITLGEQLGSGCFGSVRKGNWRTHTGVFEVAVKTLRVGVTEKERVKFLQEAAIMGQFSHPNVVKLHGVVTIGQPVSLLYLQY